MSSCGKSAFCDLVRPHEPIFRMLANHSDRIRQLAKRAKAACSLYSFFLMSKMYCIINELPLTLECELVKVIDGSKYLGDIKNVSADERILGEDGAIDPAKLQAISFDPVHHA